DPHLHGWIGRSGVAESGGKYAYDRIEVVVEAEAAAEDARISPIRSAPQGIADHGHGRETARGVLVTKYAPQLRRGAEHGKVVGRNLHNCQMFWLLGPGQVRGTKNDHAHIREHISPGSEIVELWYGKPNAPQSNPRVVEVNPHETVGLGERK